MSHITWKDLVKGVKPADLPVEQPTKFELIIKSENSKADRPDDSAERLGAGGQSDSVSSEGMSEKFSINGESA